MKGVHWFWRVGATPGVLFMLAALSSIGIKFLIEDLGLDVFHVTVLGIAFGGSLFIWRQASEEKVKNHADRRP